MNTKIRHPDGANQGTFTILGLHRYSEEVVIEVEEGENWVDAVLKIGQAAGGDFQFVAAFAGEHFPVGTVDDLPDRAKWRETGMQLENYAVVGFDFHPRAEMAIVSCGAATSWIDAAHQVIDMYAESDWYDYRYLATFEAAVSETLIAKAGTKIICALAESYEDPFVVQEKLETELADGKTPAMLAVGLHHSPENYATWYGPRFHPRYAHLYRPPVDETRTALELLSAAHGPCSAFTPAGTWDDLVDAMAEELAA